jgi:hypothetical protein
MAELRVTPQASGKELNFAPVAPTSIHAESVFSVVFEIGLMRKL